MAGLFAVVNLKTSMNTSLLDSLYRSIEKMGINYTSLYMSSKSGSILKRYNKEYSKIRSDLLSCAKDEMNTCELILGCTQLKKDRKKFSSNDAIEKYIQPIIKNDIILIGDCLISEDCRYLKNLNTNMDEEVFVNAYENSGDIKQVLEEIKGGWSFIMYDKNINKLYLGSSFSPLAETYIEDIGYIIHTSKTELDKFVDKLGSDIKNKLSLKVSELDAYTVYALDMQTKLISKTKYHHTFDHPTWIKGKTDKNGYIVLASSGVDSTTTLAYLSSLKKDVIAVYMDYGSKTCEAELIQLRSICEELNVPLIVKDVKDIFKNSKSALLTEDIDDTTGSIVESTSSWVANRNELFMSIIATMAESMILNNEYAKITITGGFPIVSDETIYPDCATRFTDKMNSVFNVSTLSGSEDRIKWENPLKYLNKTETVFLLKYLTPGLINKTVSCYNPKIIDGAVYQCAKNGQPACGPGILTKIGIIKAGIEDNRLFYEYDTDQTLQSCEGYEKEDLDIDEILRKIVI